MVLLDKLGFCLVFLDEFTVNNKTHSNYNWAQPGLNPGVPVRSFWRSFSCFAAVTRARLVSLSIKTGNTDSRKFCDYLDLLLLELKKEEDFPKNRLIVIMDGARYHSSK